MKPWNSLLVFGFLFAASLHSFAVSGETDYKTVIRRAMDAPDGRAEEKLTGTVADTIHTVTKTDKPVWLEVRVVKTFSNPDCKRLKLTFKSPEALLEGSDGRQHPLLLWSEINLCRDGSAPEEGVNVTGPAAALVRPNASGKQK